MSCTWLFVLVSFVCHQDKRPGVGGVNIYLGFYGVLAPEAGYTRGYYLDVKEHKDIFGENALITFVFICHQDKRPGVGNPTVVALTDRKGYYCRIGSRWRIYLPRVFWCTST